MMSNIYEDPIVEIVELYYETDIIKTSITDVDDEYNDTYEEDIWEE